MTILVGLIQNTTLLLTLAVTYSLVIARLPRERYSTESLNGLLFGGVALVGMLMPVTLMPGLIFDGRTVILSLAGLFGGLPAAAIAALITGLYRLWLGGPGVVMGVGTIVTAATLGVLFHLAWRAGRFRIRPWSLILFNLAVHLLALAWIPLLPQEARAQVLSAIALPFLVVLPSVGVVLGLLLHALEQRADDAHRLRESQASRLAVERRFEKLTALLPGMLYQYQQWPDGRHCFPFASANIALLFGVTPAEAARDASAVFRRIKPDDIERVMASTARAAQSLSTWREVTQVRGGDGKLRWIEAESSPEPQSDGSLLWHGYARDISEQVRIESLLREREFFFRESQRAARIGSYKADFVADRWESSDVLDDIFGIDANYSRSVQGWIELVHPEDRERMTRYLHERVLGRGEAFNMEYRIIRPADGATRWVLGLGQTATDSQGQIVLLMGTIQDISDRKETESELNHMAHYDHLTGMPNRRLLNDRLIQAVAHARRTGRLLAVCYLDLDGFKPVNDHHGHAMGDQVLIRVANTLGEVLRSHDTIARLGGDEFVLLLTNLNHAEDCLGLLERVLAAMREPFELDGITHQLSASIGVTLCPPDRPDPDSLLRHADQAMYRAKEAGKNSFHLYDAEQDRALQQRLGLLKRLDEALLAEEFVLYYQPQVDLISREVIGCEALIRWRHPEQGLLAPAAFLSVMEGSELEIRLGDWVIEQALCQIERWNPLGLRFRVSVNIAARHLLHHDFAPRLRQRLDAHPQVDPEHLELEILETAALSDFDQARQVVAQCRAFGVHFALDDFGTGYSSLAYFRALPVDTLKIDQSFVRDMLSDHGDLEIVESVVKLSHAFRRKVIAEGVETLQHAALLTRIGCRLGQGYGIARPMPAAEIALWVEHWQAGRSEWIHSEEAIAAS
ncbi:MAG: EAL domain-containing protein [Chromatiaceae bacterium]|nr:EAL domain-containing protein [Chromatiaceae bacterium]